MFDAKGIETVIAPAIIKDPMGMPILGSFSTTFSNKLTHPFNNNYHGQIYPVEILPKIS